MRKPMLCLLVCLLMPAMFFCSCKKKQAELSVRGRVFDPNTNEFVESARVVLYASKIESGIYNSNYEVLLTTSTDASGMFSFDFSEGKIAGYRISVDKEKYFGLVEDIDADEIIAGTDYTPTYEIFPQGFVKLEVENFIPYDSLDHVTYSFTTSSEACEECCDNSLFHGAGANFRDTLVCMTYGNQNVSVVWNVTKHNITTQHTASLYCQAFDTVYYKINY